MFSTTAHLILCSVILLSCHWSLVSAELEVIHEEKKEVSFGEPCSPALNVTCDPAEMLLCKGGKCDCDQETVWDRARHTCGPKTHEDSHTMTWGQVALIVGFSLTVLIIVAAFVIRKWYKDRRFKPSLEERRKSVLMEAQRGDIPMKQRKFSQHFA